MLQTFMLFSLKDTFHSVLALQWPIFGKEQEASYSLEFIRLLKTGQNQVVSSSSCDWAKAAGSLTGLQSFPFKVHTLLLSAYLLTRVFI